MSADSTMDGLARVLGSRAARALQEWAAAQSRSVRLATPEWTARGYTGAVLTAINVSTDGEADTKVIVKVCPPGPYAREPNAHRRAKIHSSEAFYADHLVEQAFPAHPMRDGGILMFQEIANASLEGVPLSLVPDKHLARSCEAVVHALLAEWNAARLRTQPTTVADFLQGELRDALRSGGSVHALASHVRLLRPEAAWVVDAGRDGQKLPNPIRMAFDPSLGSNLAFDVIRGPSHGDLHLENVLIPEDYGRFEPHKFRLVDLSTFDPEAPITRDPVTLMLSVVAPTVSQLRADEQEALLDFVLEPWNATPPRLSALMANTLEVIYRTGNETTKKMRLGEWRLQYLLSVQATALLFTSFENVGQAGRWWFMRLASLAGAAFLRHHRDYRYQPGDAVQLRRPLSFPSSRASLLKSSSRAARSKGRSPLLPAEHAELIELLMRSPQPHLEAAYSAAVDTDDLPLADWEASALVSALLSARRPGAPAPPVLVFADHLAHLSGPTQDQALHRWVTTVSRRNGLNDEVIRKLCLGSLQEIGQRPTTEFPPARDRTQAEPGSMGPRTGIRFSPEQPNMPGGSMISDTASTARAEEVKTTQPRRQIVGNLPAKNPAFTGRDQLLRLMATTLSEASTVSVVPQALHGLGGVGKTQLATEFVHRNLDRYDLVWWMSAEDPSLVRASLVDLAGKLELPSGLEVRQTITLVLDALATSTLNWLLVYDNVDGPNDVSGLIPTAGGHVIITSRNNAAWASRGGAIEVDVFERPESVELLQRHGQNISAQDADLLADKLGDLPLALEQAAIWHAGTGMPIAEYLELFDKNLRELLSEGRPPDYPHTVYGILKVAMDKMRVEAPAAAELLELFAFLGAEPISVDLLRRGRGAGLSDDLKSALQRPIELNRVIRELRRYGLARVDTAEGQRIQVHRLVQKVLHEELRQERLERARTNAQRLLATANPGYPDEPVNWPVHAEIGPHIQAAGLLTAPEELARTVVIDQIRYLFRVGDYEASKLLGEATLAAWEDSTDEALGQDRELALLAARHLADALRLLGETSRARKLNNDTFERFRHSPHFGENHEHTLYTASGRGVDLRLEGNLGEALEVEKDNVARNLRVWGEDDLNTWRAQGNLAASLRHLGRFKEALETDQRLVKLWRERFGDHDTRTLFSISNLARDLYGLGQYGSALELQRKNLPPLRDQLGTRHRDVLWAARTITISLRKAGYHADARDNGRENYHDHHARFGPRHEHTLAAAISWANARRCCGEHVNARTLLRDAVDTYRDLFGERHPLTLAAMVNLAIALRGAGDLNEAAVMDEQTFAALTRILGLEHPYSLAAANGRAFGLLAAGKREAARELSAQTLAVSKQVRGEDHPETLAYMINAALDQQAAGDEAGGRALRDEGIERMREILGADHPDTLDAIRGERMECDIEPPPT